MRLNLKALSLSSRSVALLVTAGLVLIPFLVMVTFFFRSDSQPTVVYFDKQQLEASFIRQLAERHLSDEAVNKTVVKFRVNLQKVLSDYSKCNAAVILESHSIAAGGLDVTSQIAKNLAIAMRAKA